MRPSSVRSVVGALVVAPWIAMAALGQGARAESAPSEDPPARSTFERPPDEGVWYEIFVRSFQDSDGDGIGDLRGVIDRIPYLVDLGIDGIWLMPIYPATSYHGYDVIDPRAVAPEYGTLADVDALLEAAHAAGIRVVLDVVPNHTSRDHPWFRSALAGDPIDRAKYVFRDSYLPWTGLGGPAWHPAGDDWYLGLFWSGMPDLDHRNPDVVDDFVDVMRFWLDRGVDGFRVDAIQHIVESPDGQVTGTPETLAWIRDMQARLSEIAPDAIWMGETYALSAVTVARYHRDGDLDMSLDYPTWDALFKALSQRNALPLELALDAVTSLYPPDSKRVTFISNHDQIRPATTLGALRRDEARLRLASFLLLTLPGTPMLYYGEEIGLENGPGDRDEEKRTPLPWSPSPAGWGFTTGVPWHRFSSDDPSLTIEAQRNDQDSLWWHYRNTIDVRRREPALRRGTFERLEFAAPSLLGVVRSDGERQLVVLANLGTTPVEIRADEIPPGLTSVLTGGVVQTPDGWSIPRLGFGVLGPSVGGAGADASR